MDDQILLLFKRIGESGDGAELLDYYKTLSKQNYEAFKRDRVEMNEFHKGYAFCIDSLISLFEQCDQIIEKRKKVEVINEI
jgi:hypothetical protein